MPQLSVVIIAFNEEKNIEGCLKSVQSISDDIIVVDSFSTDKTVEVSKKYNAKVFQQEWLGYAKQKNYANSLAQNDYILSLDADEVLSEELKHSIEKITKWDGVYEFNRLTNYCGSWIKHCGWYPDKKIRIFPKVPTKWEGDFVHETLVLPPNAKVHFLKGDLLHYSYHSISDHYNQIEKYSTLHAQAMRQRGKKARWFNLYVNPAFKFFKTYFLQLGFLDGVAGYQVSKISAKSVYLKYKKLMSL